MIMRMMTEESALSVVEWIGSGVGQAANIDPARLVVIIRWILVAPAAASGFFVAFYGAMFAMRFQPSWTFVAALAFGVLGAPTLVVLFGSAMAPTHRSKVAWVVYLAGFAVAALMAREMSLVLIPVGVAGAGAAWFVQWVSQ